MFFPTVTVFRRTLLIPVYVDLDATTAEPTVYPGSCMLPTGDWQLIWTLCTLGSSAPDTGIVFAESDGVKIEHGLPGGSITQGPSWRQSPTQWIAEIGNQVKELGGVIQYDLKLRTSAEEDLHFRFVHDPSIFVSKDPIEIP
jgi:hypothetical protein